MNFTAALPAFIDLLRDCRWPLVAILGLHWYRKSIADLIGRMTEGEAGVSGIRLKAPIQPTSQPMPDDQAEKPADQVEQITSGSSLPPPDEIYDPISIPILDSVRENHKSNIEAQLRWMTRLFGIATVQRGFEETHRFIFGSQLMLLYRTNAMGGSLIPEIAKQIYDIARSQWSAAYQTISFDSWIGFLLSRNLIRRSQIAGSEVFQLTPAGKAYLSYIVERQLPEKTIG